MTSRNGGAARCRMFTGCQAVNDRFVCLSHFWKHILVLIVGWLRYCQHRMLTTAHLTNLPGSSNPSVTLAMQITIHYSHYTVISHPFSSPSPAQPNPFTDSQGRAAGISGSCRAGWNSTANFRKITGACQHVQLYTIIFINQSHTQAPNCCRERFPSTTAMEGPPIEGSGARRLYEVLIWFPYTAFNHCTQTSIVVVLRRYLCKISSLVPIHHQQEMGNRVSNSRNLRIEATEENPIPWNTDVASWFSMMLHNAAYIYIYIGWWLQDVSRCYKASQRYQLINKPSQY